MNYIQWAIINALFLTSAYLVYNIPVDIGVHYITAIVIVIVVSAVAYNLKVLKDSL